MRLSLLLLSASLSLASPAFATDLNLGLSYAQSRDFWRTVDDVQNKRGDISAINQALYDRYGKPDLLFSYFHGEYVYKHDYFDSELLGQAFFGTQAEAIAGGEVS